MIIKIQYSIATFSRPAGLDHINFLPPCTPKGDYVPTARPSDDGLSITLNS